MDFNNYIQVCKETVYDGITSGNNRIVIDIPAAYNKHDTYKLYNGIMGVVWLMDRNSDYPKYTVFVSDNKFTLQKV